MKLKKNPNSIGFICASLDNMAGGLERQILRTCESFIRRGYSVFLYTYDNEGAKPFYEIPKGVTWIKCGQGLIPHSHSPINLRLKQILFLRKRIYENSISQLITFHHGLFPRSLAACLFLNVRLIVSERNSLSLYKYIKLNKNNLGYFSLFFAHKITVQIKAYVKDYPICLRKRISVINNFIKKPLEKYKKPNLEKNKVALVGRLCAQKNFQVILDKVNKYDFNHKLTIEIAGEGDLSKKYSSKYKNLIKNSILFFKGNIQDIDSFLSDSSIFCLTSLWEGYPNSLAEALRMCLPIVASKRFEGLNEFIEHGVNGYIVPDGEIIDKVVFLLKNKELLLRMSKESYKKYHELYKSDPSLDWYKLINR